MDVVFGRLSEAAPRHPGARSQPRGAGEGQCCAKAWSTRSIPVRFYRRLALILSGNEVDQAIPANGAKSPGYTDSLSP